jgi:CubicO group peptidase (beta-lactamase class C family)
VLGIGVLLAWILGSWGFMSATARRLHPDPDRAPSALKSLPGSAWADAVERGRRVMRTGLTEQNVPGLSVAVGVGGELVWAEGFGWANFEDQMTMTPDTRVRIGTASKVLTSAAVGLLLEQGRLKLDDEIQVHVPQFPKKQGSVTLRQLLAHTSGVRTDAGDEGPYGEHCERTIDGLRIFAEQPLRFDPGTRYRFSNYGWILVSAAIEAAAGEPFLTYMRDRVFGPLGMRDTVADSATEPALNAATFYFPRFAADPRYGYHGMRPIDLSCYAGSAVFLSTPSDLVRFGMAMQSGALLKPETVQTLQSAQRLPSGEETGYGLGWDLETVTLAGREIQVAGHDGDVLGGMTTSLLVFREHGIVVAVTSNISWTDTFAIAVKVAEAFAEAGGRK